MVRGLGIVIFLGFYFGIKDLGGDEICRVIILYLWCY